MFLFPAAAQVVEVLPATDVQEFFIERSGLDTFTFFLEGEVDIEKMSEACRAVVRKHSILRNIFTKNAHRMFQAILADDDCNEPPLRRIIAPDDCAAQHALIIALSHAHHDGFSVPILFNDLVVAYTGARLTPAPQGQFADVVRYRASRDRTAGLAFWRKYPEGASLTRLQPPEPPADRGTSAVVTATAEVPFAPIPPVGITLSTLVKAAWAVVLSRRTGLSDVVFGQTVNGRNLLLVGVDQILGPCINFVPFRVRLQANGTVRECLDHVQEQYLLTTDHEDVPLWRIIRESTSWAAERGESLPIIFQHQNIQHQFHLPFKTENEKDALINTSYEPDLHVYPLSEDWVFSVPYETKLKLQIVTLKSRLSVEAASCLMRELAEVVEHFARFPDRSLSSLL